MLNTDKMFRVGNSQLQREKAGYYDFAPVSSAPSTLCKGYFTVSAVIVRESHLHE